MEAVAVEVVETVVKFPRTAALTFVSGFVMIYVARVFYPAVWAQIGCWLGAVLTVGGGFSILRWTNN